MVVVSSHYTALLFNGQIGHIHFALAIYERGSGVVRFFDSLSHTADRLSVPLITRLQKGVSDLGAKAH